MATTRYSCLCGRHRCYSHNRSENIGQAIGFQKSLEQLHESAFPPVFCVMSSTLNLHDEYLIRRVQIKSKVTAPAGLPSGNEVGDDVKGSCRTCDYGAVEHCARGCYRVG